MVEFDFADSLKSPLPDSSLFGAPKDLSTVICVVLVFWEAQVFFHFSFQTLTRAKLRAPSPIVVQASCKLLFGTANSLFPGWLDKVMQETLLDLLSGNQEEDKP
jgi:hypothetical protein